MKKTHVILALLLAALLVSGCGRFIGINPSGRTITPSDNILTESREVSGFTGVDMSMVGKVVISQGGSESLTITASDNLMPLIKTNVSGGVLTIGMDENINLININADEQLRFDISVKDLNSLSVSGLGDIQMDALTTNELAITMSGAGQAIFNQLKAENVRIDVSGLGRVELVGEATQANVEISGAGEVSAPDLKIQTADISIPGLGGATVWVTDRLTGNISGGGSVSYYGEPETSTEVSGLGKFNALGSK